MKFNIAFLFIAATYAAILVSSIRHPSLTFSLASQILCFLIWSSSVLFAIRNKMSAFTGYAVFSTFSMVSLQIPNEFHVFLLSNISASTGGDDLKYLTMAVKCHLQFLTGCVGFAFCLLLNRGEGTINSNP